MRYSEYFGKDEEVSLDSFIPNLAQTFDLFSTKINNSMRHKVNADAKTLH